MRANLLAAVAAAAAVGVATFEAQAGSMSAPYNGIASGAPAAYANIFSTAAGSGTIQAGAMKSEKQGGGELFTFFCTELVAQVYAGRTSALFDDFASVEAAPIAGAATGDGIDWDSSHRVLANTGSVDSAPFQLAIWKMVRADGSGTENVMQGDFRVTSGAVIGGESRGTSLDGLAAHGWARSFRTGGLQATQVTNPVAVTGVTYQDQIAIIPLPAPVFMAGLGLLAIPLLRRRIMRR